jgi:hypothetical protein
MNALLDSVLALAVVGAALFYALPQLVALSLQPAQNDAGNQLAQMQAAGASYIKNHFAALLGTLSVNGSIAVTPAALVADGDLSNSFNDFNAFGQSHILVVSVPAAATLEGMVFTYGGDSIQDPVAIRVAQSGPANAMVVLASDPGNFEGAAGGQSVPVAAFAQAGFAVTSGHLGAHIEAAVYAAEAPFLNRYFTGTVDDNTMHTDLNLGGNNIAAAKTITATQQVTTPTIADPTTPSYQVSMAGSSTLNSLITTGSVTSAEYLHLSDARLKTNIRPIDDALGLVSRLAGHRFDWRRGGGSDLGFVAQEVQDVIPEAVRITADGSLAVKYDVLAAPLAEAIKQQSQLIAAQQAEIAVLGRQIDQLQRSLSGPERP